MTMDLKVFCIFSIFLVSLVADVRAQDETEKPLLRCYVCSGVNNICGDASDLGTETTCPAVSETFIVSTEGGGVTRMCGRKNEYVPKCVNDDTFCFCSGDLCNAAPDKTSWITLAAALLSVLVVLKF